jgi:hypothetical protein
MVCLVVSRTDADRKYEELFLQVLQGVAANWDEQRLLKLLGDRLSS